VTKKQDVILLVQGSGGYEDEAVNAQKMGRGDRATTDESRTRSKNLIDSFGRDCRQKGILTMCDGGELDKSNGGNGLG